MLKQLRRRRLRIRLSLVAVLALLWSQMLMAGHGGCVAGQMPSTAVMQGAMHGHCHDQGTQADRALCQTHCDQRGSSPASPPVALSVPALPPEGGDWAAIVLQAASRPAAPDVQHMGSVLHRPTPHPASVLLI